MKPILWVGSSLEDLKKMPEAVRKEIGHSLREIQKGRNPGNIKPLRHLGTTGVSEIVFDEREGTFRTVYTAEFKSLIAVLHVFQKKSKSGIVTPKKEMDWFSEGYCKLEHNVRRKSCERENVLE
jgi:phage-related protein